MSDKLTDKLIELATSYETAYAAARESPCPATLAPLNLVVCGGFSALSDALELRGQQVQALAEQAFPSNPHMRRIELEHNDAAVLAKLESNP